MPSVWRLLPTHQPAMSTRSFAGSQFAGLYIGRQQKIAVRKERKRLGITQHEGMEAFQAVREAKLERAEEPAHRLQKPELQIGIDQPIRFVIEPEKSRQQVREAVPTQIKDADSLQQSIAPIESPNEPGSSPAPRYEHIQSKPISRIPPSILYQHWDLAPPSLADLKESRTFFTQHPAKLLFSAHKLLDIPFTSRPEVAIVGRSNVGKSTLLNALLQSSLAKTSSKRGKTKTMNAYSLGGDKMTLLDMPGYGRGSREEWGVEITKYLQRRKELRRVFVLIDAIHQPGEGRVKREDLEMLAQLREMHIPHQVVLGKADRALFTRDMKMPFTEADLTSCAERVQAVFEDVKRTVWSPIDEDSRATGLVPFGQLLAVTGETGKWAKMSDEKSGALGVDALRWALLVATGYAKALPSRVKQEKKASKEALRSDISTLG